MIKSELATQLRVRVGKWQTRRERLKTVNIPDDAVIDSYITCSCCGEKQVNEVQLIQSINEANSANHWFDVLDRMSESNR